MEKITDEFRSDPEVDQYHAEMSILDRRSQWLKAVVAGEADLDRLMKDQENSSTVDDAKTTSQDLGTLSRAGPCKDFQQLVSAETLIQHGIQFRSCTSNAEVKACFDTGNAMKRIWNVLMGAVKGTKADLQSAKKKRPNEEKRRRNAQKEGRGGEQSQCQCKERSCGKQSGAQSGAFFA